MKKTILFIELATLCLNFKAVAQINTPLKTQQVQGKVIDEQGKSLPGATLKLIKNNIFASADSKGRFTIKVAVLPDTLLISFIGYESAKLPIDQTLPSHIEVNLKPAAGSLNEVQVIGYGTTTKRLNTGSVSSINAADIEKQPVTNLQSALSGRMPGVFVQTTNGLPGGGINIQIRGKGSILAGTDPLYIIDEVPYSTTLMDANSAIGSSAINGLVSPLNSINPQDIESITVLKDADATAIYGSRAANGVVLITTKKGKAGKTKLDVNISQGYNKSSAMPSILSLDQYLQIRREAYKNDGLTPSSDPTSSNYAPDLTVYSQTQGTNFAKYMLGGTGHVTDMQAGVSGGDTHTTFSIGGNFHSETTVLPGDNLYQRGGLRYNFQHKSLNNKFSIALSGVYTVDANNLVNPVFSYKSDIFLPPNFPLTTPDGSVNWQYGLNPLADINARLKVKTDNFLANLVLKYNLLSNLDFNMSIGYNKINIDQRQTFPLSSQNPQYSPVNYAYFTDNSNQSIIIEPKLNYTNQFGKSTLNLLAGGTYQSTLNLGQSIDASNFSSDELLQNLESAGSIRGISNSYLQYKYVSVYGRINYNYDNKYIINATVRRDGSSRFGPGNQFGNFGSVGGAWLFGQEDWLKAAIPFLSYGKLRASYGIVGNDQISDYQYLSTYINYGATYQDISGLQPYRIANADFHWEVNKKLEFAVELGFLKDRILLTVDRYQTRSSNQLVAYAIPNETGFSSYEANLPAVVQNTGWEVELNTKNILQKDFSWTTSINISVPKNKLVSFQNFANSSYTRTLAIGQDISRVYGYQLTGVDPNTGFAAYTPQPGSISANPYFYNSIGKKTPDFFGGFGNTFSYKNWQLDIFGQFVKQMARGDISYTPGVYINNYQFILKRWQQAGDVTSVPKSSTNPDYRFSGSSANYFDASYFRLKNVSLSYNLPKKWLTPLSVDRVRIYAEGQNLFTWWHKNNPFLDPESGGSIPPVRAIVFGAQFTF